MKSVPSHSAFALLDDRHATAAKPTSRLYTDHARTRRCEDPRELDALWRAVEADQRDGLHALLLIDYEWGAKLVGAGRRAGDERAALRVLLFRSLQRLAADEVADWLGRQEGTAEPQAAGAIDVRASVDEAAFHAAIDAIHEAIRAGETYQVNYTYRLDFQAHGTPTALYRRLRARQPVPFGAFIALPADEAMATGHTHVLSCSPELFVRHADGALVAKPMKGTAPRRAVFEGDSETARHLQLDTKNRAENLMIVDLLRNDLGRIAEVGSVKVPQLFDIESHATVFQMTSTVHATMRADLGFPAVLRALFPCGSITGAPKHQTMKRIAELESTPRGPYCGAIGWIDAPTAGAACADFCLSVAIRTLTLGKEREGLRAGRLGIGAGIVLDSEAADEYAECQLKARFLTGLDPGFALFETMHATRAGGVRDLDRHLARLAISARQLGFRFDEIELREALQAEVDRLAAGGPHRVKLVLERAGRFELQAAALHPLPDGPPQLRIADETLPDARPLAGHKTTLRALYDAGVRAAEAQGCFDSLFFTGDGRLVEGGRSNVFVKLGGRWFTPPLADGALPGIARATLLADAAWAARERSLTRDELRRAEAIVVCNALRGALPARLA
ncbi:MAG TPA: aminodeoxychorismate synthase component I [Methylibium sp.]|uniref:aminodeoxychorismate synthase component I n=1 Tax=Methylibium sp. TaxID=2067992 RepID=UPI002DB666CD|nr:aminodeoxychorismate synthase component I [Methylibium sp.]HEU4459789.1 aminodeoxychorismate synthase component I [Methylibium sp.]